MGIKRQSYSAKTKLEAIEFAEINGNRAAAREYNVSEKSIREWRLNKNAIKLMNPTKRALRGSNAHWESLENDLCEWILSLRSLGRCVSTTSIKLKAKAIAKKSNVDDFKASSRWCSAFMLRNKFSLRRVTSTGQSLPEDFIQKVNDFRSYFKQKSRGIDLKHIGNMDEVPMCFDMPSSYTVDRTGGNNIKINTTGSEKNGFTVVLCVTADGNKLPPMVIFKRKTIPKEKFPNGIIVSANEKGWINEEMFIKWVKEVWCKRPCTFFRPKSILAFDSAPAHLTAISKKTLHKTTISAVIPGGLTKLLQPLDISVNRSFKLKIREEWEKWMVNGFHSFTKSGKIKKASCSTVCEWILLAFNSITKDCIINGFKKAGILNDDEENTCNIEDDLEASSQEDELVHFDVPEAFLKILDEHFDDSSDLKSFE